MDFAQAVRSSMYFCGSSVRISNTVMDQGVLLGVFACCV